MSTAAGRPLYARMLRLRRLRPGGLLCFLFFEGTTALAALLVLAELVVWWAVLVLPLTVALVVKVNDMVADAAGSVPARPVHRRPHTARGVATVRPGRHETTGHTGAHTAGVPHHEARGSRGGLLASLRQRRSMPRYVDHRAH